MYVLTLLFVLAVASPPSGVDTLVVCPPEFRSALEEWESHRRSQGHTILTIAAPPRAEQLRDTIRAIAQPGQLKYVVIIGDEASRGGKSGGPLGYGAIARQAGFAAAPTARSIVPTNYLRAKVNVRWGSEDEIASDMPYADVDGDHVPDLAIGRIPAHSAAELSAVVRKIIDYERPSDEGAWQKCLNIVSGPSGFGAVTDAVVEAAGRQVIQQTVPAGYDIRHTSATMMKTENAQIADLGLRARRQLSDGGLAWIYLGHGLPTELDRIPTPLGKKPILSTQDVPDLRCGPHRPLAVLIACYTGAMDAAGDCLAEDLLLAERGPIAVIAATRVTMPYGNTTIGCELLRACFRDQPTALGDVLRLAQQRTLVPATNDQLRASLDNLAGLLSPGAVDLENERYEHVLMYHLIGDPLLRLKLTPTRVARVTSSVVTE